MVGVEFSLVTYVIAWDPTLTFRLARREHTKCKHLIVRVRNSVQLEPIIDNLWQVSENARTTQKQMLPTVSASGKSKVHLFSLIIA